MRKTPEYLDLNRQKKCAIKVGLNLSIQQCGNNAQWSSIITEKCDTIYLRWVAELLSNAFYCIVLNTKEKERKGDMVLLKVDSQ